MNLIYKATNMDNGKSYIGITSKSLLARIEGHKSNAAKGASPFSKAIRKYGIDGFRWDVIRVCLDVEEMKRLERFYISEYGTHSSLGNGYNATLGGDGISGYVFTEEAKKKISKASLGRIKSEETRKKLSAANKGKPYKGPRTLPPRSEEVKRRMYENNPGFSGKKWSESHREKVTERRKELREIGGLGNQKLKPSDYSQIMKLREDGWSFEKIGLAYDCSASAIFYFVNRMSK